METKNNQESLWVQTQIEIENTNISSLDIYLQNLDIEKNIWFEKIKNEIRKLIELFNTLQELKSTNLKCEWFDDLDKDIEIEIKKLEIEKIKLINTISEIILKLWVNDEDLNNLIKNQKIKDEYKKLINDLIPSIFDVGLLIFPILWEEIIVQRAILAWKLLLEFIWNMDILIKSLWEKDNIQWLTTQNWLELIKIEIINFLNNWKYKWLDDIIWKLIRWNEKQKKLAKVLNTFKDDINRLKTEINKLNSMKWEVNKYRHNYCTRNWLPIDYFDNINN